MRWTKEQYAAYQARHSVSCAKPEQVVSGSGYEMTDEIRQRMSDSQKQRASSQEERSRRSKATKAWINREGHPKGFTGHKRTDSDKAAISEGAKKAWSNPEHVLNSDPHRQRLSDHFTKVASSRSATTAFSRTKKGMRADLGISFRSSWEANYARYLNWLKAEGGEIMKWEYETETFWFQNIKRGCRSWKPDFRVVFHDGRVERHEVKGWMYPRAKTALKRMAKYHPGIVVVLIDEARYKAIAKVMRHIIKEWE